MNLYRKERLENRIVMNFCMNGDEKRAKINVEESKFGYFTQKKVSIKFSIPRIKTEPKTMENYADNVENPVFSRFFFLILAFGVWEILKKNLVKSFFKIIHFPRFAQSYRFNKNQTQKNRLRQKTNSKKIGILE